MWPALATFAAHAAASQLLCTPDTPQPTHTTGQSAVFVRTKCQMRPITTCRTCSHHGADTVIAVATTTAATTVTMTHMKRPDAKLWQYMLLVPRWLRVI